MNRWSSKLTRRVLRAALPTPKHESSPAKLSALEGWPLAQTRMREAVSALTSAGESKVEAFRKLRLELNRLEQGGLDRESPKESAVEATGEILAFDARAVFVDEVLHRARAIPARIAARVLRAS